MTNSIYEQIEYLPIYKCEVYAYNPFESEFADDEELSKSIISNGVILPVIVRPVEDRYQVVVGQRRFKVLCKLNKKEVPAIVRTLTDREAKTIILETNINQRGLDTFKHSELARAIYEYHTMIKSQGKRNNLIEEIKGVIIELENYDTFSPVGEKLNSAIESGKKFKLSARTVSRYLRLYQLNDSLKELVDLELISIRAGVELSFLTENNQTILSDILNKYGKVSWREACILRKYQEDNIFTYKQVEFLLSQPVNRFTLDVGFKPMKNVFKKYSLFVYSQEELENIVDQALNLYFSSENKEKNKINWNKC